MVGKISKITPDVSTHSRAKAAAGSSLRFVARFCLFQHTAARRRLLTFKLVSAKHPSFNTQPREGGCNTSIDNKPIFSVSTHSRAKAAAPHVR